MRQRYKNFAMWSGVALAVAATLMAILFCSICGCGLQTAPDIECNLNSDCAQAGNVCRDHVCVSSSSPDFSDLPDGSVADAVAVNNCKTSAECEDSNPCTTDVCAVEGANSSCVHHAVAGCAIDVPDLGVTPDLTAPVCLTSGNCNDDDVCTLDICEVNGSVRSCRHDAIAGCSVGSPDLGSAPADMKPAPECNKSADCNDGNECTSDTCEVGGKCRHFDLPYYCGLDMGPPADLLPAVDLTPTPSDIKPVPVDMTPSCNDGRKNGTETDVDCGGGCVGCDTGKSCNVALDCWDAVCKGGICQAALCHDNIENGFESDIDCGFSCGGNCQNGKKCNADNDCASDNCVNRVCQPQTIDAICSWYMEGMVPFIYVAMSMKVNNEPMQEIGRLANTRSLTTDKKGLTSGDQLDVSVEYKTATDTSWSCFNNGVSTEQRGTLECVFPPGALKVSTWSMVGNGSNGCNLRTVVP